ncbi:HAD-IA family hydrolase [Granulicella arctica]|uniref:HAD-IA family hydrolase n=1 Tax=Granulicella arctica TaxID=940613 RepID=UPI0021E0D72E|nr:HAD-IA family hydrolase [Granulicella arctica]
MKRQSPITTLFVDVGEVLLTNGWDHLARKRAARHFHLDWASMEERHRLVFETHEEGKLTFEEYLHWVVFFEKRSFTRAQFQAFWFEQSKPYPKMIDLIGKLKTEYKLKIVVVSNESRAVNAFRIEKFKLDLLVDTFVSSCFVGMRKPDSNIFKLALDLAQAKASETLFIDNTLMFTQVAQKLGIRSILHTTYNSTCTALSTYGLKTGKNLSV